MTENGGQTEEQIISGILNEDDSSEEEETDDELTVNAENIEDQTANTQNIVEDLLENIDPDEVEDFEWIHLNKMAIDSVRSRVHRIVPRFLGRAEIDNIDDLSFANPPFEKKIIYHKREMSWWRFIEEVVRDLFPEFTYKKYKINKIDFANLIVREIIVPLAHLEKGQKPELDTGKIEEQFNDIFLKRLVKKSLDN
jgi:hypothetical protein